MLEIRENGMTYFPDSWLNLPGLGVGDARYGVTLGACAPGAVPFSGHT